MVRLIREKSTHCSRSILVASILIGVFLLAGCGTTSLSLKPSEEINFAQYRTLAIQTSLSDGVVLPEFAQTRMKELVKAEIMGKHCPKRFENVSVNTVQPQDLLLVIKFTKYDEGNRFARLMLAGLGSMKINAEVEVKDAATGKSISKGEAGYTFAWGGVYGAATGIEDVEKSFAMEVSRGVGEMLGIAPPAD